MSASVPEFNSLDFVYNADIKTKLLRRYTDISLKGFVLKQRV